LLQYARDLARKLNVSLEPLQLSDRRALSAFVDQAKTLLSAGIGVGIRVTPAADSDAPTERQVAYARSIASRAGATLSAATLANRRQLSLWIDAHKAWGGLSSSSSASGQASRPKPIGFESSPYTYQVLIEHLRENALMSDLSSPSIEEVRSAVHRLTSASEGVHQRAADGLNDDFLVFLQNKGGWNVVNVLQTAAACALAQGLVLTNPDVVVVRAALLRYGFGSSETNAWVEFTVPCKVILQGTSFAFGFRVQEEVPRIGWMQGTWIGLAVSVLGSAKHQAFEVARRMP
jgi:hypothetical protein